MPQATFYTHVADIADFICRLSMRAVEKGARVLVWAETEEEIERIDLDLWRNPPESFLPHSVWQTDAAYPQDVPLALACGSALPRIDSGIVVLNVSEHFWCDAPAAPERVLEIVGESLEDLAAARERFRAYRQQGFTIEHYNMQGKA
ncbi:DNA polymerase III subunit chi [Neisseria wadsworthii]|uniref:DNA-directed DNA polymerase III chi subunit n=1 Tax=Neisseria wadsworthii 9715 TaxID=1030841 RepID=G4CSH2_9NEIS|nr:DNA polymerase III subunit chi [Neisseria wadsworthii]EGZ44788.1 DNA-directed DNA polymerase III chi subunit [Neisseria wadsworthii 9715]QMT35657.1 DNA polymerase III subunit chi [Neisseria wadsworthii]